MLAYKLFGSGLTTLTVASMTDVATGLAATGANQGAAYEVTYAKNAFTTVASGTGAVLDADAAPGDSQLIYNGGANALRVYPPSGAAFNNLSANAAVLLAPKTACEFHMLTTTLWTAVLSA
jgi:hypothetical protein